MLPTDMPDLRSTEFARVRSQLAVLFINHRIELQLDEWSDESIVALVDDIAGALWVCMQDALTIGDQGWLDRHRWFGDACERLFADQPAVPLDG
jgi:hypothetical protein